VVALWRDRHVRAQSAWVPVLHVVSLLERLRMLDDVAQERGALDLMERVARCDCVRSNHGERERTDDDSGHVASAGAHCITRTCVCKL
jgi:hypothetical protein